jgi:NADH dehydrogenase FAD-containing subunit
MGALIHPVTCWIILISMSHVTSSAHEAENYFVFQPFLPEVIGTSFESRHVTNPIRLVLRHFTLKRAEVTSIQLEAR